jgi:hypothetical protein
MENRHQPSCPYSPPGPGDDEDRVGRSMRDCNCREDYTPPDQADPPPTPAAGRPEGEGAPSETVLWEGVTSLGAMRWGKPFPTWKNRPPLSNCWVNETGAPLYTTKAQEAAGVEAIIGELRAAKEHQESAIPAVVEGESPWPVLWQGPLPLPRGGFSAAYIHRVSAAPPRGVEWSAVGDVPCWHTASVDEAHVTAAHLATLLADRDRQLREADERIGALTLTVGSHQKEIVRLVEEKGSERASRERAERERDEAREQRDRLLDALRRTFPLGYLREFHPALGDVERSIVQAVAAARAGEGQGGEKEAAGAGGRGEAGEKRR